MWVVTATGGEVSRTPPDGSGAWDGDGSAPDPYLCLNINMMMLCTDTAPNTFSPRWLRGRFPPTTAAALMAGVQSTYADEDIAADDNICLPGPIRFTTDDFTTGSHTFRCDPYGSFALRLEPAP